MTNLVSGGQHHPRVFSSRCHGEIWHTIASLATGWFNKNLTHFENWLWPAYVSLISLILLRLSGNEIIGHKWWENQQSWLNSLRRYGISKISGVEWVCLRNYVIKLHLNQKWNFKQNVSIMFGMIMYHIKAFNVINVKTIKDLTCFLPG